MIRFTRISLLFTLSIVLVLSGCRKDWDAGTEAPLDYLVKDGVLVTQNPYGRTPQSAIARFKTFEPCKVIVSINGQQPIEYEVSNYVENHETPIVGLYHNAVNEITLTITDQEGVFAYKHIELTIGHVDDKLPEIEVNTAASNVEPGLIFCDMHLANYGTFATNIIAVDNFGKIRYHLDLEEYGEITWPLQRFKNGNLFLANQFGIYEFNMLGKELNHWNLAGYRAHHDLVEMPNGNILVSVQKYGTTVTTSAGEVETTDDHIIEFNPSSGSIVTEWDLREVLDIDRYDLSEDAADWFHMNAVWYSETDDCIIVSGRNQAVVKIDRNNNLKWILAPHLGWEQAGATGNGFNTSDYLLTAVDGGGSPYSDDVQNGIVSAGDFDWCWGQHAPMILENGNYLMFDNGFNRQFGATAPYSRAVEYSINEQNKTVKQVWSWGEIRGASFFSPIISDVDVLNQTGNRLITSGFIQGSGGSQAKVVEISHPMNTEEFEITLNFKNTNSSGEFGWGQIDIVYRAERMPMYEEQN